MRLLPGSSVLFALLLMSGPLQTSAWAGLNWQIGRGTWTGGIGLRYSKTGASGTSDGGSASDASSQSMIKNFYLNGRNLYVLDPRLININLGVNLDINKLNLSNTSTNNSTSKSSYSTNWLGYNFVADFLREKPYNGRSYANRRQIETQQAFGGRSTGISDDFGLNLVLTDKSVLTDWGFPWFTASLTLKQNNRSTMTSFFDYSYQDESSQRGLYLTASKGFINADLAVDYSLVEVVNALQLQPSRRDSTTNLSYSQDFGPGLNRQFSSSLVYATSGGTVPGNTLQGGASLHIDHLRNLSSNYTYKFHRQELGDAGMTTSAVSTAGFVASDHKFTAAVSHQLYQNLSTSVSLDITQGFLPNGSQSSFSGGIGQGYSHSLPGGGSLNLNWSSAYHHNSNTLSSDNIKLVGEVHFSPADDPAVVVPGFFLEKLFVNVNSIQVFNVQTGVPVLLTPVPPDGGTGDYQVIEEGNRVRIVPNYGLAINPNAPIKPGDKLEVSYTYNVDANVTYEARDVGYDASVSYGWFGANFQHQQSQTTPLTGEVRFVDGRREDLASVWLKFQGVWRGFATSADASHTRRDAIEMQRTVQENTTILNLQGSRQVRDIYLIGSAGFYRYRAAISEYDTRYLSASLSWSPRAESYDSYNWRLALNANVRDVFLRRTGSQSGTRDLRGSLEWKTPTGWQNSVFARIKTSSANATDDQTAMEIGAITSTEFGKTTLNANVSLAQQRTGSTRVSNQYFHISALRSFD